MPYLWGCACCVRRWNVTSTGPPGGRRPTGWSRSRCWTRWSWPPTASGPSHFIKWVLYGVRGDYLLPSLWLSVNLSICQVWRVKCTPVYLIYLSILYYTILNYTVYFTILQYYTVYFTYLSILRIVYCFKHTALYTLHTIYYTVNYFHLLLFVLALLYHALI